MEFTFNVGKIKKKKKKDNHSSEDYKGYKEK